MIAPEIAGLTSALRQAGLHITIETAGTVYEPVQCDLMSISPKLSNSVPLDRDGGKWAAQHNRLRYQPEVLGHLIHDYEYQLKFVVSSPEDLQEIDSIRQILGAPPSTVVLMPEGIDAERLRDRGVWLAEVCKTTGYRYSPRLHIDLWGNKRGI
jgi:7-carboxy-7-deazaguanine synthase